MYFIEIALYLPSVFLFQIYSMRPAKSTQSLHSTPSTLILREHPQNSSTLFLLKPPKVPPRGNFTSFYNTRGKLSALR
jgi:hypothetical protein